MSYLVEHPKPTLGPCRCQGCGEPLWWAERNTRRMGQTVLQARWREEDGTVHYCPNAVGRIELRAPYRRRRLARARATWDNGAAEYSGPITHTAQRPSVRLYSEREGVGFPEYRRNA